MCAVVGMACLDEGSSERDSPQADQSYTVADSAGIPVIWNEASKGAFAEAWRLEPVLTIGAAGGPPESELFLVTGGTVLSDGTVVIMNSGTSEIRFFDSNGRFLRSAGRRGEGPGEINGGRLVGRLPGDSLVVEDVLLRRISIFGSEGQFVRSYVLGSEIRTSIAAGVLADGSLIHLEVPTERPSESRTGTFRDSVNVRMTDSSGQLVQTLGTFPGQERVHWVEESRRTGGPVPFGRAFYRAIAGDRFVLANSDAYSIQVWDTSGTPLQIIRLDRPSLTVGGAFDDSVAAVLRRASSEDRRLRDKKMFDLVPPPEFAPAFVALFLTHTGQLWVEDYPEGNGSPRRWQVFGPDGRVTARAETSVGLEVLEIGEDYLLGLVRDSMGVEQVQLNRLVKR